MTKTTTYPDTIPAHLKRFASYPEERFLRSELASAESDLFWQTGSVDRDKPKNAKKIWQTLAKIENIKYRLKRDFGQY